MTRYKIAKECKDCGQFYSEKCNGNKYYRHWAKCSEFIPLPSVETERN